MRGSFLLHESVSVVGTYRVIFGAAAGAYSVASASDCMIFFASLQKTCGVLSVLFLRKKYM